MIRATNNDTTKALYECIKCDWNQWRKLKHHSIWNIDRWDEIDKENKHDHTGT